jgi:hypothetical protein
VRSWWAAKLRRTRKYIGARVSRAERQALAGWLTTDQLELFDRMPASDGRHGLDVVAALRRTGATDSDLLVAGLLHDCGKGPRVRLVHRVVWALGQHYGEWIWTVSIRLPTVRTGLDRLRRHPELSARLAAGAGCSLRTVELIRLQENPVDAAGLLLHQADEAN